VLNARITLVDVKKEQSAVKPLIVKERHGMAWYTIHLMLSSVRLSVTSAICDRTCWPTDVTDGHWYAPSHNMALGDYSASDGIVPHSTMISERKFKSVSRNLRHRAVCGALQQRFNYGLQ
jgi:hypothetical protein